MQLGPLRGLKEGPWAKAAGSGRRLAHAGAECCGECVECRVHVCVCVCVVRGQVWALRFGPYGEQLALTWQDGKVGPGRGAGCAAPPASD